jgi:hypothetical protein
MPEISRFFGIVIKMFWNDHHPPHFHAFYGDEEALVDITSLSLFAGHLTPRALGLVMEWSALHQRDLLGNWPPGRRTRAIGEDRTASLEPTAPRVISGVPMQETRVDPSEPHEKRPRR